MNGIKFWCYNAGHVLGAAMFMIEIAGVKVLYTGDFSRIEDRHLMAAEVPTITPDVLITVRLGRRAGVLGTSGGGGGGGGGGEVPISNDICLSIKI